MTPSHTEPPSCEVTTRVLISLIVLVGAGASFYLALRPAGASERTPPQAISEPLNAAKRARVTLRLGVGDLRVEAPAEMTPATLLDATLQAPPGVTLERRRSDGGGVAELSLTARGSSAFSRVAPWSFWSGQSSRRGTVLNVNLTGRAPLDLSAALGSGDAELSFARLRLGQLRADGGSGDLDVTLPAGLSGASLSAGSGDVTVRALQGNGQKNAALSVRTASGGSGSTWPRATCTASA